MSRTYRNRTNKPLRRTRIRYERPVRSIGFAPIKPRCFESGKPKVCYSEPEAHAAREHIKSERGATLRVYRCGPHFHLTHLL